MQSEHLQEKPMSVAPSGIAAVGDLPWGSHFCQFYEDRTDLADSLVPFFKAGLDNNERCLWVTSEPFDSEDARAALRAAVPDLDGRERDGQIEIVDYRNWYLRTGDLSADEVVKDWLSRAQRARSTGYKGLRLTGNTFWLECDGFDAFSDYEATVNRGFTSQPIIALCSYCLGRCRPTDVLEVVRNHQFAVARRRGAWEVIEDASLKIARAELERLNGHLDELVRERTSQLEQALRDKTELFHEVHHRVRNNLQVLGSLVRMKLTQANAPEVRQACMDVLGRIDAIGFVHDALYGSGEASSVPIAEYLEKLCDGLVQTRHDQSRVGVKVASDVGSISLQQAVPLGLITNELVTNALKHAFPGDREGTILVSFECAGSECALTVSDNGVGLASVTPGKVPSRAGLHLVKALAAQLGGDLEEATDAGTLFRVRFARQRPE
jgi:two-component system, sensor histidine kinase PdtaS